MRVFLTAIGKLKSGPENDLFQLYLKRLKYTVEIFEYAAQPAAEKEGLLLLSQIPAGCLIVALDEQGQQLTSLEFAHKWQSWQELAPPALVFVIGGADGLSDEIRNTAHFLWSLGKLTWPHLLVRGLLCEQLYRAQQIIAGHPYHRN